MHAFLSATVMKKITVRLPFEGVNYLYLFPLVARQSTVLSSANTATNVS